MDPEQNNPNQNQYLQDKLNDIYSTDLKESLEELSETINNEDISLQQRLLQANQSFSKMKEYIDNKKDSMTIYEREDMEKVADLISYFSTAIENDEMVVRNNRLLMENENHDGSLDEVVKNFALYNSISKQKEDLTQDCAKTYFAVEGSQKQAIENVFNAYAVAQMHDYNGKNSRLLQDRYDNLTDICYSTRELVNDESLSKKDLEYISENYEVLDSMVNSNKRVYNVHKKRLDHLKSESENRELNSSEIKKLNYSKEVVKSHGRLKRASQSLYNSLEEKIDQPNPAYASIVRSRRARNRNVENQERSVVTPVVVPSYVSENESSDDHNSESNPDNSQRTSSAAVVVPRYTPNDLSQDNDIEAPSQDDIHHEHDATYQQLAFDLGDVDRVTKFSKVKNYIINNKKKIGKKIGKGLLIGAAFIGGYLLGDKVNDHLDDYAALKNQVITQEQSINLYGNQIEDNKSEIVRLNDENDLLEQENDQLEESLAGLSASNKVLRLRNDSLDDRIDDLQQDLSNNTRVIAQANSRINYLEENCCQETIYQDQDDVVVVPEIEESIDQDVIVGQYESAPKNDLTGLEPIITEIIDTAETNAPYASEVIEPSEEKTPFYKKLWRGTKKVGGGLKKAGAYLWDKTGINQYVENANGLEDESIRTEDQLNSFINGNSMHHDSLENWKDIKDFGDVWNANWHYAFSDEMRTGEEKEALDKVLGFADGAYNATAGNVLGTVAETGGLINNGIIRKVPLIGEPLANVVNLPLYWLHREVGGYEDGSMALKDVLSMPVTQQALENLGLLADVPYTSYDANQDGEVTIGDLLTGTLPIISQARQDNPIWNGFEEVVNEDGSIEYIVEGKRQTAQDIAETLPLWMLLDWLSGNNGNGGNAGNNGGSPSVGGGSTTTPGVGGISTTGSGVGGL